MEKSRVQKIIDIWDKEEDKQSELSLACNAFMVGHSQFHRGLKTVEEVVELEKRVEILVSLKALKKENTGYLIWSIEHGAWWRAGWNGYTKKRSEAGIYPLVEANKIVKSANIGLHDVPNEAIIKYE